MVPATDEAHKGPSATYTFYQETLRRNSIDERAVPPLANSARHRPFRWLKARGAREAYRIPPPHPYTSPDFGA